MAPHRGTRASVRLGLAAALTLISTGCARQQPAGYQGYVEGRFVYVASPQSGRLEHLAVARGETIGAGHALFALEADPEAEVARQAQQALRSSESKLADLSSGKRPPEIDVTRAQLMQALAEKNQADQILASDRAQYGAGGIPRTDLINAQEAADSSAAKVRELKAQLVVDALPAREQQIRAQQNEVAADRAALAQAEWRLGQKQVSSPRHTFVSPQCEYTPPVIYSNGQRGIGCHPPGAATRANRSLRADDRASGGRT